MKKNRAMRIAALLLVLTMMTSCFVGGTFAKYTTSGGTTLQEARVAKWGVTITGEGTLFAKSYNETGTVTVESSEYVVAPGTSGALANYTIAGTPEVATEVKLTAEATLGGTWVDGEGKYYCPLIVTITVAGGTAVELCGLEYETAEKFAEAIEGAITSNIKYAPGADLATKGVAVSWTWLFDEDAHNLEGHTAHVTGMEQNDTRDTFLGDLTGADVPTISLKISCTIDQVD